MQFISCEFFLFLLISVLLYYIVPKKFKWIILLFASYIYYFLNNQKLTIFLIISTISIYISGLMINKIKEKNIISKDITKEEKKLLKKKIKKKKKIVLILTIIINLGILIVLKYTNFFIGIFRSILFNCFKINLEIPIFNFILPLGISYYTLQAISYIVDVYRGKYDGDKNLGRLALYLSFFPQVIEGPISRYDQTADQLYRGNKYEFKNIKIGILLILWGIMKKIVIADRAGIYVDNVFSGNYQGITVLIAIILYTIQIYVEFSGCMNIVMGIGKLYGVNLPDNFKRPFFSKSIQEFWRRWHITLGTWLKDYIFYPISLSKMNAWVLEKAQKIKIKYISNFIVIAFPLFFVWFCNGFWHGSGSKYILYGLYYYVIMMLGVLLKPIFDKIIKILKINVESKFYKLLQIVRTIILVMIGLTIFRATSFNSAMQMIISIFNKTDINQVLNLGITIKEFILLIIMTIVIFIISLIQELNINIIEKINEKNIVFQWLIYIILLLVILIFGIYGIGYSASSFIYGGF